MHFEELCERSDGLCQSVLSAPTVSPLFALSTLAFITQTPCYLLCFI